jgi:hypothetical protein
MYIYIILGCIFIYSVLVLILRLNKNEKYTDITQSCHYRTNNDEQSQECDVGQFCDDGVFSNFCKDLVSNCGGSTGCNCGQGVCTKNSGNCRGTVSTCNKCNITDCDNICDSKSECVVSDDKCSATCVAH